MSAAEPLYIRQIRTGVVTRSQFFGSLLLNLDIRPDSRVETAVTNSIWLRYNPEYVEALVNKDFEQALGLFAHEAYHCGANHPMRVGDRDLELANEAADYVANAEIVRAGFKLPDGFLFDKRFDGMAFERVYNVLARERQKQGGGGGGKQPQQNQQGGDQTGAQPGQQPAQQPGQQPGQNQPQTGNQPGQQPGSNGQQPQSGKGKSDQQGQPQPGKGNQPGAGNQPGRQPGGGDGDGKDGSGPGDQINSGNCGGFVPPRHEDGTALTPNEKSKIKTKWEVVANHARMVAKRIGNCPGAADTIVQEIHEGKADWVEETRRFLRRSFETNYSWLRPDRRFIYNGLYIPSLHTRRLGEIVLAVDTSKSVSDRELTVITAEIISLLREVNPKRVHIVYCDTQIQLTITYEPDDYESIQLHYPGRGGTRCRPVFNWVEEQDFNPVCMIYFSDMEINDWGEEPEYPVLWAATDRRGHAPWGEQIQLDEV